MITKLKTYHRNWLAQKASLGTVDKSAVEIGETILVALLVTLSANLFLIKSSKVVSGSMIPTLKIGDRLFVDMWSYRFHMPKMGDIVLFKSPQGERKEFVKRLVGVGGDRVAVRNGRVFVNDQALVLAGVEIQADTYNMAEQTVPEGHYFMMGDNRANSFDSRFWGFVPHDDIVGKAMLIYWPLSSAKRAY